MGDCCLSSHWMNWWASLWWRGTSVSECCFRGYLDRGGDLQNWWWRHRTDRSCRRPTTPSGREGKDQRRGNHQDPHRCQNFRSHWRFQSYFPKRNHQSWIHWLSENWKCWCHHCEVHSHSEDCENYLKHSVHCALCWIQICHCFHAAHEGLFRCHLFESRLHSVRQSLPLCGWQCGFRFLVWPCPHFLVVRLLQILVPCRGSGSRCRCVSAAGSAWWWLLWVPLLDRPHGRALVPGSLPGQVCWGWVVRWARGWSQRRNWTRCCFCEMP